MAEHTALRVEADLPLFVPVLHLVSTALLERDLPATATGYLLRPRRCVPADLVALLAAELAHVADVVVPGVQVDGVVRPFVVGTTGPGCRLITQRVGLTYRGAPVDVASRDSFDLRTQRWLAARGVGATVRSAPVSVTLGELTRCLSPTSTTGPILLRPRPPQEHHDDVQIA